MSGESIAECLSGSLGAVRDRVTDLENAVEQDQSDETWGEAMSAASELEYAAEQFRRAIDRRAPDA